jgi:hypothetical protein
MELCEDADIFELLREEEPVDWSVHISAPKDTWVSGVNEKFDGASLKEVKSVLGSIVDPKWVINLPEKHHYEDVAVPDSFDART